MRALARGLAPLASGYSPTRPQARWSWIGVAEPGGTISANRGRGVSAAGERRLSAVAAPWLWWWWGCERWGSRSGWAASWARWPGWRSRPAAADATAATIWARTRANSRTTSVSSRYSSGMAANATWQSAADEKNLRRARRGAPRSFPWPPPKPSPCGAASAGPGHRRQAGGEARASPAVAAQRAGKLGGAVFRNVKPGAATCCAASGSASSPTARRRRGRRSTSRRSRRAATAT